MPKTIVTLINGWASGTGGIETVNRELSTALARITSESEQLRVVCLCRSCSADEEAKATSIGVTLMPSERCETDTLDSKIITMLSHEALRGVEDVVCVVGHSRFTGTAARNVRDHFFPKAKVVVVYHIDPDELEAFKGGSAESERRSELERRIIGDADVVFAVGPRLARSVTRQKAFEDNERGPSVHCLLCGMYADAPLRRDPPRQPTFLFIGRVEDTTLKGVDLFAGAAGEIVKHWHEDWEHAPEWEPRFIIRGFPADESKAARIYSSLRDTARRFAKRDVVLIKKTFSTDPRDLQRDILDASAVVMSSRVEGFGLVAMEALSYGVPAIVSEDSGVGEMLKNALQPGTIAKYVIDTRGDSALQSLSTAFRYFALLPERSREVGHFLRGTFAPLCSWDAAAAKFWDILRPPDSRILQPPEPNYGFRVSVP